MAAGSVMSQQEQRLIVVSQLTGSGGPTRGPDQGCNNTRNHMRTLRSMRGARAKAGLAVCLVTAATVPLAVAGAASAAGPAKTARYIVVQDAASASGLGALGKADVDGERFAALGAVVTDLTHDQAAELNEVPGVTVSPDIRVNLVPDPGFKPTAPKRDGAPLTSLRPEVSSTVASRSWGLDRLDQRSLPLSH